MEPNNMDNSKELLKKAMQEFEDRIVGKWVVQRDVHGKYYSHQWDSIVGFNIYTDIYGVYGDDLENFIKDFRDTEEAAWQHALDDLMDSEVSIEKNFADNVMQIKKHLPSNLEATSDFSHMGKWGIHFDGKNFSAVYFKTVEDFEKYTRVRGYGVDKLSSFKGTLVDTEHEAWLYLYEDLRRGSSVHLKFLPEVRAHLERTNSELHRPSYKGTYVRAEISRAPAFSKGFVCQCLTCYSLFAKQPVVPYCPICKHGNLNREYKQDVIL